VSQLQVAADDGRRNRRHARVLVHPTSPASWESTSFGRPRPMIEFLFDTTRAVVNLVLNGTVARHPGIEFVIAHAGAALPVIADRVAAFTMVLTDVDSEADVMRDLARLHYDLAGFPIPRQLDAILALTTLEHLHYGSDYPFTPEFVVEMGARALAGATSADGLGTLRSLPRRNVQPLCVKPLVERPVVGGEPGQVAGVLDGVRVGVLAPLEAGAGADVHVPACGPAPLGPFAGLPGQRPRDEGQPDRADAHARVHRVVLQEQAHAMRLITQPGQERQRRIEGSRSGISLAIVP
jgi:hypothetical protein